MNRSHWLLSFLLLPLTSCSLFGIQNEESPKYKILHKEDQFEIREYSSYIVAKTTVKADFDDASGKAFRILAGYIFGKNEGDQKISMTSPVEMNSKSEKIAMTSPVQMQKNAKSYTMAFSMPSKYTMETLPKPLDKRIIFEKVEAKLIASHEFSWLSSQEKNDKKAAELKDWMKKFSEYRINSTYSYAGYNPPWTIPFLRRNEVHFELK